MKTVFADTLFWIARTKPGDPWTSAAKAAELALGEAVLVTTEEVLAEFVNALRGSPDLRKLAVDAVRKILSAPTVSVIPQTHESFLKGIEFFQSRPDKRYSLTDCISMNLLRERKIDAVLTNDHHFEQEGFAILIKEKRPPV